jgi:hypothetical protein
LERYQSVSIHPAGRPRRAAPLLVHDLRERRERLRPAERPAVDEEEGRRGNADLPRERDVLLDGRLEGAGVEGDLELLPVEADLLGVCRE